MILTMRAVHCYHCNTTVIDECYKLRVRGMQAGRISTQGGAAVPTSSSLDQKSEEFKKLKERVLLMEVSTHGAETCESAMIHERLFFLTCLCPARNFAYHWI